ncbi:PTS transporter subunit EIIC [Streptococcus massiliensis]|uniref:PTS system beta-glucoside-specific transporter subunit IIABC n=1 Tax=Streptococcus massiliensis TaxID=313439 RepID=A0A380KXU2_9STRE|nr:PTS transporter subunit EIIC [Streptococcus massiliensis]SUN75964.1 PTS system beta-glucoside-specific transporter subunit IIABC [Streptococcus massiliensis]
MNKKEIIRVIVENLGGKENIINFSHCSTRLRFDLKTTRLVNCKAIEGLKEVMSVVEAAGQVQVVIGPNVIYYYPVLEEFMDREGVGAVPDDAKEYSKKNIFSGLIDIVSSLFTPLIDVLIGAGILKGVLSILVAVGWLGTSTGTYEILNAASDSLYYFLPIILAITASRRFKTNLYVSVTVAGALLYPNITSLYNSGAKLTFLGIPFVLTAFKSSVFPIIFAILLLSYVERIEAKLLPESIRSRLAPFFSLLVVVPITIIIFGPIGSTLSNVIAHIYSTIYTWNPTVAGGFIGALAQVMVVFGIHWGLFPIIFSNIEKFGFDTILAVFGPSIIAQSGATFGVYLKTKNKELKKTTTPTTIMGFFGISEPAIYAVNLKFKKPFIMAIIGGGIGGAIAGATGARAVAVAVAAVPTFPAYFGTGFVGFLVGYFGAFILTAVLTYFFGYDDSMLEDIELAESRKG